MSFLEGHHVNTGVPITDELMAANDWVTVSNQQLCRNARFFDNDPNVQTGFNFRMDAILNGGIIFKRRKHKMAIPMHDFMQKVFTTAMRQVLRYRWIAGFCGLVWHPHPKFVGEPDCIDLTQVVVKKQRTIFHGQPKYRYFYRPTNGTTAELEIHNVMTFSWDAPDNNGNLRSLIQLLQRDQVHEDMLMYYSLIAMKGRAMPVMITEKESAHYDHDNIKAPTARAYEDIMGDDEAKESHEDSKVTRQTEEFFWYNQPTLTDVFSQNASLLQAMPHFSSTYQLAEGRKFKAAPHPEGPEAHLLLFRIARQERAYALMGVPMAMVSNSASTGHSKLQKESSNSFVLFDNSQQSLKQDLIAVAKTMFYAIHLPTFLAEYRESTPPKDRNPEEEAKECEVIVEMPSIPDENKLVEYYNSGWLRYEVLVAYLASRHGISIDSWHFKPQLNLREANDIDPPEKAAAKAAPKKK